MVSEHSAELGDCIIDHYLTGRNAVVYADIVSRIVLSNYALIDSRVKKLHGFVIKNIRERSGQWIVPFLLKEIEVLHLVSLDSSNKHSGRHVNKIILETQAEDLVGMVHLAMNSWSSFKEDLVKLSVTLALVGEPFHPSD